MTYEKIVPDQTDRTCTGCGNPTPADRVACQHCGFAPPELLAAQQEAANRQRFVEAVFTRPFRFTMIFIGLNVGVFALMWLTGGESMMSADTDVLLAFGAKFNPLIREQHQYWRLITSMFIHIGVAHIFLNMYALWIIGQQIEQLYGAARFVVIYLGCGIGGSLGSLFFSDAISAGASGAIFGLFGVMASFGLRYRKELPGGLGSEIAKRVLPIIAINLVFGFSTKIVDNAAHLGGLLTGVALCFLIPYKRPDQNAEPAGWRALLTASLLLITASFVTACIRYDGPPLSLSNLVPNREARAKEVEGHLIEADKTLREAINSLIQVINDRNPKADLSATREAVERAIQTLNAQPNLGGRLEKIRGRLLDLLARQRDFINQFMQSSPRNWDEAAAGVRELKNNYQQFVKELDSGS